ncbi:hypothetical protein GBAR_LOCUS29329, partial [Geodia barretti]
MLPQQQQTLPQQTTVPQQTMTPQQMLPQQTTLPQQTVPHRTCDANSPLPLNSKLRNRPLVMTRPPDSTYYTIDEANDLYKHYIDNDMPGTLAQLL